MSKCVEKRECVCTSVAVHLCLLWGKACWLPSVIISVQTWGSRETDAETHQHHHWSMHFYTGLSTMCRKRILGAHSVCNSVSLMCKWAMNCTCTDRLNVVQLVVMVHLCVGVLTAFSHLRMHQVTSTVAALGGKTNTIFFTIGYRLRWLKSCNRFCNWDRS